MKKFFLIIFILIDGLVVFASGWFLYMRFTKGPVNFETLTSPKPSAPAPAAAPGSPAVQSTSPATTPASPGTTRKILFSYRNSKARKVMIRADFTGWRAEPMQKDTATSTWKYMAVLDPGEYAYCFSVDDKSIRDPANKRTKQVGKTVVSSIVVQPPSTPN